MNSYSIAIPEKLEELDCQNSKKSIIDSIKRALNPKSKVEVKFLTKDEGYFKLSNEPVFVNNIALFRLYVNGKFIGKSELIKR